MTLFSKLFGKSSLKEPEEKKPSYTEDLELYIIYDSVAFADVNEDEIYQDLENEFRVYASLGESGVVSSHEAKEYGIPLPALPEYPVIGVFNFSAYKGYKEGYKHPLFLSSDKEEVKRFFEEYERTHP
ncbi:hypothetical protein [Falsibacillus pallidus]|uniref:hypothetical protein n=1 Tax=Falsibacillus pallidus TaxID=493781 RepID=UPI003D96850D